MGGRFNPLWQNSQHGKGHRAAAGFSPFHCGRTTHDQLLAMRQHVGYNPCECSVDVAYFEKFEAYTFVLFALVIAIYFFEEREMSDAGELHCISAVVWELPF